MLAAVLLVDLLRKLLGNQALAVKTGDGEIHYLFYPVVAAHRTLGVRIHCDDSGIGLELHIVHNDDPVGLRQIHRIDPGPAGEHQTVVQSVDSGAA